MVENESQLAIATAPQGLMIQLKGATAELHRHAETRTLQRSLIAGMLPTATYRNYLIELHAVHSALERELATWLERRADAALVVSAGCRHSENLCADIEALACGDCASTAPLPGGTQARRELLRYITDQAPRSVMPLLGCLYVLEGSMNGNKYIARALARAWHVDDHAGLRYLDPYGDGQLATWQSFRAAMDAIPVSDVDIEAAIEAACLTFQAIAQISDEVMARCA